MISFQKLKCKLGFHAWDSWYDSDMRGPRIDDIITTRKVRVCKICNDFELDFEDENLIYHK